MKWALNVSLTPTFQKLGREFPILMGKGVFQVRVLCPEKNSLNPKNNSLNVKKALNLLVDCGLLSPKIKIRGLDLNSEQTASNEPCDWQVLYATYLHTCSPLRFGETLLPIPLYRLPSTCDKGHGELIQWQTQWQACDELQMLETGEAEYAALSEIQDVTSHLFRQGLHLREKIESLTQIPTYYYQYRVGGEALQSELERACPVCGNA